MFAFLKTTMSASSLRFFSFFIGKNDQHTLSRYFSVSFWCYSILACVGVLLAETVGIWFVKNYLVIPADRLTPAIWVFQCVVITFVFDMMLIPFNAIILARERMDIYAYVGIIEAVAKLLVAFALLRLGGDKLILYGLLTLSVAISISIFYISFDLFHFKECHVKRIWDKGIFKDIFSFSSWSLYGSIALMLRSQGINILLNMFFGPIVNTARAISYQINNALLNFVNGFYQAVRPQMTKYYSIGDERNMLTLAYRSSRLSFYLFYFFSVPLLIEIPYILKIWLGNAPDLTVLFVRLVLINSIIESMALPFKGVISATGKIKWNELINGTIRLLNFPLAWLFFKLGYPPEIAFYIAIISGLLCHIVRLKICVKLTSFTIKAYFHESLFPIIIVSVLSPILPCIVKHCINSQPIQFICVLLASVTCTSIIVWTMGLFSSERAQLVLWIKNKLHKSSA